jgi:hypothetical protein
MRLTENEPRLLDHLGISLEAQGNIPKAISAFQSCLARSIPNWTLKISKSDLEDHIKMLEKN